MKKLLLAVLLFSPFAFADGNNNNTIIVRPEINIKNCCCAKKPKTIVKTVVKEVVVEKKVIVEKPVIVEKVVEHDTQSTVYVTHYKKIKPKKNRISVLGGLGPQYQHNEDGQQIDLKTGPVAGAQYQRLITERISLGVVVLTNATALGTIGFDF